VKRVELDGKVTGVYADYHYVGTGDIGGAANEEHVRCSKPWSPKAWQRCRLPADAAARGRGGRSKPNRPHRLPGPPVKWATGR
jgi:hypothetical protein